MNIQFKKGVIELCVLSLLSKEDCYGYQISEILSWRFDLAEGTVYPILRRLKSDGFVTTYISEASEGPPRKYYSITKTGTEFYHLLKAEWKTFTLSVEKLLNKGI